MYHTLTINFQRILSQFQGLVKKVVEEKPQFVGINLERPDDVVIDVDDEERLTRIVSIGNIGFNTFPMKKPFISNKMISDNDLMVIL